MAERNTHELPPGYVVLDGRWVRKQVTDAAKTFVSPIVRAADIVRGRKEPHPVDAVHRALTDAFAGRPYKGYDDEDN